jgi:hypothetical protein
MHTYAYAFDHPMCVWEQVHSMTVKHVLLFAALVQVGHALPSLLKPDLQKLTLGPHGDDEQVERKAY